MSKMEEYKNELLECRAKRLKKGDLDPYEPYEGDFAGSSKKIKSSNGPSKKTLNMVKRWLEIIGETDQQEVERIINLCNDDQDLLNYIMDEMDNQANNKH